MFTTIVRDKEKNRSMSIKMYLCHYYESRKSFNLIRSFFKQTVKQAEMGGTCNTCPGIKKAFLHYYAKSLTSKAAWPIIAAFYVEPRWKGRRKVYINGPGHMTKMAATPIYVKNLKILLLWNKKAYDIETWHAA